MNELKQAISEQNCLMASLQLAKIFQPEGCQPIEQSNKVLAWVEQARVYLGSDRIDVANFKRLVSYFYVELAFSGDERNYFACEYSLVNQVLDFRTGIPVSLAIVFQAIAQPLGFAVSGVNFPGHFLLKCQFVDHPALYVDPLNGNYLSQPDLAALYFSILQQMEDEKMPEEALNEASCDETIVRLLHNLKASFINEKNYSQALTAVELLVNLCPNDPYERRDRGFLLHQLDCTQVAIADYQYFIRQCPQDPARQLLEVQLQQLCEQHPVVLH